VRGQMALTKRGGKQVKVASPLTSTLEVITRRDTICKGEKAAREEERTNYETKRRTTDRWLGLSSFGRAESRTHANKKRR
jgi:hypothetical protein